MTPEGRIRQHLKKQCKAAGLSHRKLKWIAHNSAPDEFVFRPESTMPIFAFIEVKKPGNWTYQPGQERELQRLRDAGFQVYVVDSELMVDLVLSQLRGS